MGEIAEAMRGGSLCEGCGEYFGDECGFARLCAVCAAERRKGGAIVRATGLGGYQEVTTSAPKNRVKAPKRVRCPGCNRRFVDPNARDQHYAQMARNNDPTHPRIIP